ncbi:unnamed protein product [Mesocestoides corti]|uniref:Uncharacterized protein n=1 Tax=Mesocestoides corti TaxID=53468 RepID=A0A0R3U859_MESCO|nr:unnamed protein product [Mesocestoides corti]
MCLSSFKWHARMTISKPENNTDEWHYIMIGVASVVDSDGRRLARGSGFNDGGDDGNDIDGNDDDNGSHDNDDNANDNGSDDNVDDDSDGNGIENHVSGTGNHDNGNGSDDGDDSGPRDNNNDSDIDGNHSARLTRRRLRRDAQGGSCQQGDDLY